MVATKNRVNEFRSEAVRRLDPKRSFAGYKVEPEKARWIREMTRRNSCKQFHAGIGRLSGASLPSMLFSYVALGGAPLKLGHHTDTMEPILFFGNLVRSAADPETLKVLLEPRPNSTLSLIAQEMAHRSTISSLIIGAALPFIVYGAMKLVRTIKLEIVNPILNGISLRKLDKIFLEQEARVKRRAAECVGAICTGQGENWIWESEEVRHGMIRQSLELGEGQRIAVLETLLRDPKLGIIESAARELEKIGKPVSPLLLTALREAYSSWTNVRSKGEIWTLLVSEGRVGAEARLEAEDRESRIKSTVREIREAKARFEKAIGKALAQVKGEENIQVAEALGDAGIERRVEISILP